MGKINHALYILICILFLVMCLAQILTPVEEYSDSLSLFNPVYMYANYGKLVYPIHGYFDNMPVHPPLFYKIQGFIFKCSDSQYLAYKLPVLLLFLYFFFLVVLSKFSSSEKIIWIASFLLILFFEIPGQRADFFLTMCFVTGIFHLEYARRGFFETVNILIGSVFMSLASVLHYFGSFAFLGIMIYALWFYKKKEPSHFRQILLAASVPMLVIIGGYIIIQIIPNIRDIGTQIFAVKGIGDPFYSLKIHCTEFSKKGWAFISIPPIVITALIVILKKDTIWLFLASLPVVLFVLLFSSGKSSGYYLIELFSSGLIIGMFLISTNIFSKYKTLFLSVLFGIMIFFVKPIIKKSFSTNRNNATLFRKGSHYLFGDNNVIGSRMDLWYISGTNHYLNLIPLIIWNSSTIANSDTILTKHFDLIVEHKHMSNNTLNPKHTTILGMYLSESIYPAGYLYQSDNSTVNMTYYSKSLDNFKAIIFSNSDTFQLAKQNIKNPDAYFISLIVSKEKADNILNSGLKYYTLMSLVDTTGNMYQLYNDTKEFLAFGFIDKNLIKEWLQKNNHSIIRIKDTIPIKWGNIARQDIETIETNNVLIYDHLENLKAGKPYY